MTASIPENSTALATVSSLSSTTLTQAVRSVPPIPELISPSDQIMLSVTLTGREQFQDEKSFRELESISKIFVTRVLGIGNPCLMSDICESLSEPKRAPFWDTVDNPLSDFFHLERNDKPDDLKKDIKHLSQCVTSFLNERTSINERVVIVKDLLSGIALKILETEPLKVVLAVFKKRRKFEVFFSNKEVMLVRDPNFKLGVDALLRRHDLLPSQSRQELSPRIASPHLDKRRSGEAVAPLAPKEPSSKDLSRQTRSRSEERLFLERIGESIDPYAFQEDLEKRGFGRISYKRFVGILLDRGEDLKSDGVLERVRKGQIGKSSLFDRLDIQLGEGHSYSGRVLQCEEDQELGVTSFGFKNRSELIVSTSLRDAFYPLTYKKPVHVGLWSFLEYSALFIEVKKTFFIKSSCNDLEDLSGTYFVYSQLKDGEATLKFMRKPGLPPSFTSTEKVDEKKIKDSVFEATSLKRKKAYSDPAEFNRHFAIVIFDMIPCKKASFLKDKSRKIKFSVYHALGHSGVQVELYSRYVELKKALALQRIDSHEVQCSKLKIATLFSSERFPLSSCSIKFDRYTEICKSLECLAKDANEDIHESRVFEPSYLRENLLQDVLADAFPHLYPSAHFFQNVFEQLEAVHQAAKKMDERFSSPPERVQLQINFFGSDKADYEQVTEGCISVKKGKSDIVLFEGFNISDHDEERLRVDFQFFYLIYKLNNSIFSITFELPLDYLWIYPPSETQESPPRASLNLIAYLSDFETKTGIKLKSIQNRLHFVFRTFELPTSEPQKKAILDRWFRELGESHLRKHYFSYAAGEELKKEMVGLLNSCKSEFQLRSRSDPIIVLDPTTAIPLAINWPQLMPSDLMQRLKLHVDAVAFLSKELLRLHESVKRTLEKRTAALSNSSSDAALKEQQARIDSEVAKRKRNVQSIEEALSSRPSHNPLHFGKHKPSVVLTEYHLLEEPSIDLILKKEIKYLKLEALKKLFEERNKGDLRSYVNHSELKDLVDRLSKEKVNYLKSDLQKLKEEFLKFINGKTSVFLDRYWTAVNPDKSSEATTFQAVTSGFVKPFINGFEIEHDGKEKAGLELLLEFFKVYFEMEALLCKEMSEKIAKDAETAREKYIADTKLKAQPEEIATFVKENVQKVRDDKKTLADVQKQIVESMVAINTSRSAILEASRQKVKIEIDRKVEAALAQFDIAWELLLALNLGYFLHTKKELFPVTTECLKRLGQFSFSTEEAAQNLGKLNIDNRLLELITESQQFLGGR